MHKTLPVSDLSVLGHFERTGGGDSIGSSRKSEEWKALEFSFVKKWAHRSPERIWTLRGNWEMGRESE
jgi:hypothetical protein